MVGLLLCCSWLTDLRGAPLLQVFFAEPSADAAEGQALAAPPFWAGASALFAFPTREDREQAVAALRAAPALGQALPGGSGAAAACSAILEADPAWLSRVTAAWQVGAGAWLGVTHAGALLGVSYPASRLQRPGLSQATLC